MSINACVIAGKIFVASGQEFLQLRNQDHEHVGRDAEGHQEHQRRVHHRAQQHDFQRARAFHLFRGAGQHLVQRAGGFADLHKLHDEFRKAARMPAQCVAKCAAFLNAFGHVQPNLAHRPAPRLFARGLDRRQQSHAAAQHRRDLLEAHLDVDLCRRNPIQRIVRIAQGVFGRIRGADAGRAIAGADGDDNPAARAQFAGGGAE